MKTIILLILAFTMASAVEAQTNKINRSDIKEKKDLPEGVTNEWIKDLKDENGNRIVQPSNDSGDAFQTKIFNGFNPGDQYSASVASAGDVNGDGYNDILIGAPYNESSGTDAGRAYIYFGGSTVNSIPDIVLSGNSAYDYFGISVSGAGDLNGDGYDDVIVGAYGFLNTTGEALVFFGGLNMNNVADLTITGESESDFFGNPVASAGDLNGDGYADLIIGATNAVNAKGRAYICFGGQNMDGGVDLIMTGETDGDQFGVSVSGGDANNDGFSDVLVGANVHSENTGRAYLFYGSTNMNNVPDKTFDGQNSFEDFGIACSFAGDINGDSYNDIIIGATGYNGSTGIVYVYFGGADMNNTSDAAISGINFSGYFGGSVSGAGDINGDGFADILIGAPFDVNGKAYVYFGGPNMNTVPDFNFSGESANSFFGCSVAYAKDMNGDGFSDLIVGAKGFNSYTGKAYLYMESMTGTMFPNVVMDGDPAVNFFGYSIASAGDVNGDGYSEVIVGSNNVSAGLGKAYIFLGGENMDNVADVVFTGITNGTYFGRNVGSAGDVNGDGYSDVLISEEAYNTNTGRIYLYYGGQAMNNTADVIMTGEGTNGYFGCSLSKAGDVNGDGYGDVIVGAFQYPNPAHNGKVYIYLGGSAMDNIADYTSPGDTVTGQFGYSVSAAGDVNGDGYSDVMISSVKYGSYKGKVTIWFGGQSMNYSGYLVFTGYTSFLHFGNVVSTAGDVNGDGYSDVMISTENNKVYIYFGGYNMDNIADLTLTGSALGLYFGESISEAGDLNGDGYSDVIVSEKGNSSYNGHAYIYYGGVNMNNIPDVILSGEGPAGFFGLSVSSAGDVNGDGIADLAIGSLFNNPIGRAYIYYGSIPSVKPNLISIKDIPDDQGGSVKLKWAKSGFDIPLTGTITSYLIERSIPPGASGFQWEQIGSVLPTQNNLYYYFTSSTPSDTGISGNSTFYFRVTAYTGTSTVLYRSNIKSGSSIDNLAPVMVQAFSANPESNNVRLTWNRNHEPDLKNYVIYRSTSPSINIDSINFFAVINDTTYLDTSPLTGAYYYFIAAQDIHNNKSTPASSGSHNITINLTASIEGFYNPASNTQVSDSVNVYLRNVNSPYATVDSARSVLTSIGNAEINFGNAASGQYYIVIKHRNALETWSRAGGENLASGGTYNYNMSDLSSKAFGNNLKQIDASPVRFGIYSGDVNHDGFIDLTDVITVYNDGSVFVTGYVNTDVNGDNITDLTDLVITYNNSVGFVGVVRP